MISDEIKQEVLNWIAGGCNYQDGVTLYLQYGKNSFLKRVFQSHQSHNSTKLAVELCTSVGLNYFEIKKIKKMPVLVAPEKTIHTTIKSSHNEFSISENYDPAKEQDFLDPAPVEYPAIIRRVILEYAETFQERSRTHKIMADMPEGNSQSLKIKRAELFTIVKQLTVRLESLYNIQEVYKRTGFIPSKDEIWPTPKQKAKTELPDDIGILKKMKKNQQSSLTKDHSLLDFQSEKHGTIKRPMPNGPKRIKIENRIKGRLKMIDAIDCKLKKENTK